MHPCLRFASFLGPYLQCFFVFISLINFVIATVICVTVLTVLTISRNAVGVLTLEVFVWFVRICDKVRSNKLFVLLDEAIKAPMKYSLL